MGYVVVGVLGFDEKFLARCLMRAYTQGGLEDVTVLVPEPGDEHSRERVEAARESLRRIVEDYMGVRISFASVPRGSLGAAFHKARKAIEEALSSGRPVLLCLSGGMRYMLLALLAALLSVKPDYPALWESRVEADLESGEGSVGLPAASLRALASLEPREVAVLEALWSLGEAGPSAVAAETGLPKSTAYRILEGLARVGLVERLGRGRYRPLRPLIP